MDADAMDARPPRGQDAEAPPGAQRAPSAVWQLVVEEHGGDWCVCTDDDGTHRVVSRHPDRASADAAVVSLESSSDRGAALRGGRAIDATGSDVLGGAEHERPAPPRHE